MAGKNQRFQADDTSLFFDAITDAGTDPTVMTRYQELTRKLRVSSTNPDSFVGLSYVTSKLAGEAGEVAEQWGKAIRDDDLADRINDANEHWLAGNSLIDTDATTCMEATRLEKMADEAGDTLYYLSELLNALGLSFEELATRNIGKLQERDARGALSGEGSNR